MEHKTRGRPQEPPNIDTIIEPKGSIKLSETGSAHIPVDILKHLKINQKEIPYFPDSFFVILYNPDTTLEQFLIGLDIMKDEVLARFSKLDDDTLAILTLIRDHLDNGRLDKAREVLDNLHKDRIANE